MYEEEEEEEKKFKIGDDIEGCARGDYDDDPTKGYMSANYQGKPENADPNYEYLPSDDAAQSISDWTNYLEEQAKNEKAQHEKNDDEDDEDDEDDDDDEE